MLDVVSERIPNTRLEDWLTRMQNRKHERKEHESEYGTVSYKHKGKKLKNFDS